MIAGAPAPFRGFGSPSCLPWFWTSQDRPSASPTHEAALHPSSASGALRPGYRCPGPRGACRLLGANPALVGVPPGARPGPRRPLLTTSPPLLTARLEHLPPSPPPSPLLPSHAPPHPPPLLNYESRMTGRTELGKEKRGNKTLGLGVRQNNQGRCLEMKPKKKKKPPLEMKDTFLPRKASNRKLPK